MLKEVKWTGRARGLAHTVKSFIVKEGSIFREFDEVWFMREIFCGHEVSRLVVVCHVFVPIGKHICGIYCSRY